MKCLLRIFILMIQCSSTAPVLIELEKYEHKEKGFFILIFNYN